MTVRTGTLVDSSLTFDAYHASPCHTGLLIFGGYQAVLIQGYLAGILDGGNVIEATQSVAKTVSIRILDAATGQPRTLTSADASAAVVQLKKIGAAFGSISPVLTRRDTYLDLDLTSGNLDTLGITTITVTIPNCVPAQIQIDVVAINKQDAVRLGLSSLPNAVAGASGGVPLVGSQIPNAAAGANEGVALYKQVQNIAVTSAALNRIAASRTITSGSGSGGVANTATQDGVYDALSDSAGTLDFYYEFDLSSVAAAVAVGAHWTGYLVGAANTAKVYARNFDTATWDQIGTVAGVGGSVNEIAEEWELTSSHIGTGADAGLVRIRFANTGLTAATLNTDRILVGYVVIPATAQDVSDLGAALPTDVNTALTSAHGTGSWRGGLVGPDMCGIAIPGADFVAKAYLVLRSDHLTPVVGYGAKKAFLDLAPHTTTPITAVFQRRLPGNTAHAMTLSTGIVLSITSDTDVTITLQFIPGVTTVAQLCALIDSESAYVETLWPGDDPSTVLQIADAFGSTAFGGGDDDGTVADTKVAVRTSLGGQDWFRRDIYDISGEVGDGTVLVGEPQEVDADGTVTRSGAGEYHVYIPAAMTLGQAGKILSLEVTAYDSDDIPVSDPSPLRVMIAGSDTVDANLVSVLGGAVPTPTITGVPKVDLVAALGTATPAPAVPGIPKVEPGALGTDAISAAAVSAAAANKIGLAAWAQTGEGSNTYGDLLRGIISALVGKATDFRTGTVVIKSLNGAKTRWTVTTNAAGRQTVTAGDLTA